MFEQCSNCHMDRLWSKNEWSTGKDQQLVECSCCRCQICEWNGRYKCLLNLLVPWDTHTYTFMLCECYVTLRKASVTLAHSLMMCIREVSAWWPYCLPIYYTNVCLVLAMQIHIICVCLWPQVCVMYIHTSDIYVIGWVGSGMVLLNFYIHNTNWHMVSLIRKHQISLGTWWCIVTMTTIMIITITTGP